MAKYAFKFAVGDRVAKRDEPDKVYTVVAIGPRGGPQGNERAAYGLRDKSENLPNQSLRNWRDAFEDDLIKAD